MVNRRVTLGVLVVVQPTLTLATAQVGAQTPPVIREYLGEELVIEVDPSSALLCVAESTVIVATVQKYGVYQDVEERWYVPRPRPYRVANNSWGRSLPEVGYSSSDPSVVRFNTPFTDASGTRFFFPVVGTEEGSTTIEFRVRREHWSGPSYRVEVSVDIEVTECDYEVHTFSIWHLSTGWNTVIGSSIDTVIVRQPQAPGTQHVDLENLSAKAENTAVEFPGFGCGSSVTLSTMRAPVTGEVSYANLLLKIRIEYPDIVPVSKTVSCHGRPGSSQDTGRLDPIDFVFDPGGGVKAAPHTLRATGLGDFAGITYITVTPIHR